MTNDNVKDFAEVMNRIARVPISAVPRRTTTPAPESKPSVESRPAPAPVVNNKDSDK
ncbi:MAG: hypothetical protein ACI4TE_07390 [Alphaproteobacteria bacterium]